MSNILIFALVISLSLAISETGYAADKEKGTYVGGGRYVGEGKSVDDAQVRQRSDEYSERQYDRQRSEERYERAERRERWERDDRNSSDGY